MPEYLYGTAAHDLPTRCGRGIAEGEDVKVRENGVGGFVIVAPGGRRNHAATWDALVERVEVG